MKIESMKPTMVGEMLVEEFLVPYKIFCCELANLIIDSNNRIEGITYNRQQINLEEGGFLAIIFNTDKDFWMNLQKMAFMEINKSNMENYNHHFVHILG
ncbi:addiction module antidote protein, HigA family [Enterobacter kobei]|nr:addiction module antidote protein, HigA family [Enterobacter kobei]